MGVQPPMGGPPPMGFAPPMGGPPPMGGAPPMGGPPPASGPPPGMDEQQPPPSGATPDASAPEGQLAEASEEQQPPPGALTNGTEPTSLTLYVNNLNDKINADILSKGLREIFSAFGEIQDLVCMKSLRRRGQAWIVFKELQSAGAALKALQGFPFYNKPIRVAYAKSKSDVVAKADGTYEPRAKIKNTADRRANEAAAKGTQIFGAPTAVPHSRLPDNTIPSRTLFVENLPLNVQDGSLQMLFRQFVGFQEVRLIDGRNVAFADFGNEAQAAMAMQALQGFAFSPGDRKSVV